MAEQLVVPHGQLPSHLECQVLSFTRVHWWEGFSGDLRLRDWIHRPEQHPFHFVLAENRVLISYVGVIWKYLEHAGERYKTYGLSGVFTYPAFRCQGYGSRLVEEATEHIRRSDADIGLFTCDPSLRDFYGASG